MELRFPDRSFGPATGGAGEFTAQKLHKLRVEDLQIPERELKKVPHSANQEKITTRRRRSFDQNVWKSITHLRTTDIENTAASNELRNGHVDAMVKIEKKLHDSRRRRSFDHKHGGTQFGNRALGADLVHKELHDLQTRHMKKLKQILGCAEANIMFIHAKTRDLLKRDVR